MKSRLYNPLGHTKYHPFKSMFCAFEGLIFAFNTELNLTIQLLVGLSFFGINIYFDQYILAVSNLIFMAMTISFEMINTIVENLCDMIEPNYNSKIKVIKDLAAAAVLVVALVWAVIIGFSIIKIIWLEKITIGV